MSKANTTPQCLVCLDPRHVQWEDDCLSMRALKTGAGLCGVQGCQLTSAWAAGWPAAPGAGLTASSYCSTFLLILTFA